MTRNLFGTLAGLFLWLLLIYLTLNKLTDWSWVVFFLATFAYLLFLGLTASKAWLKMLWFNLSAIFFSLLAYEGFLLTETMSATKEEVQQTRGSYKDGGYFMPHPYLGYRVSKDGVYTSLKTMNSELIYDVAYTIKDGLRYTPNSNEQSENCALFFGCSYTIGEGLGDSSTLPFYFNQFSAQCYKVLNYGFHGYGPHQMLAYIENRVFSDIKSCVNKKIAVYSLLPHGHIARAAGYSDYDRDGPNYEVIKGSLEKSGTFRKLPKYVEDKLAGSHIYRMLCYNRKPSHEDLIRTVEIIKKSNTLLKNKGVNFYLFMWDNLFVPGRGFENMEEYNYFVKEMNMAGIKVFFLHDAIPDYGERIGSYTLPHDGHPNALANRKIADYLFQQINAH